MLENQLVMLVALKRLWMVNGRRYCIVDDIDGILMVCDGGGT
jgi:hypothetical protein